MSGFASYDSWKLSAPEDEPGYWENQPYECPEDFEPEPTEEDVRAEAEAKERDQ